eukprot:11054155-Alexandrium_andersonii.AAC.1
MADGAVLRSLIFRLHAMRGAAMGAAACRRCRRWPSKSASGQRFAERTRAATSDAQAQVGARTPADEC